jgi:hypothetical protein
LVINERNVEDNICKMEKREMRRERKGKYNVRPHLLKYTKREGQGQELGQRREASEYRGLTNCRAQRMEVVRTGK